MTSPDDNGVYFFLGNISSHILHALPLWQELRGTFVVTSKQTQEDIRKYDVPVVMIDDISYRWMKLGKRPKRIHEYLMFDAKLKKTYDFLNTHAKVVVFYELFELKHPEWLTRPKKIFLTHGNMLKSYMTSHPKRLDNIIQYDYMAALSPYMKAKFIADGVPKEKLVDIGVARTDELLDSLGKKPGIRQEVAKKLTLDSKKPIILYTPTFWGESSIHHTGLEVLRHINDNFSLLFRPHPQTPKNILKKYQNIVKRRNNIYLIDHTINISLVDLLVSSNVIIIDRSSIALEALLTDIPVIFAYDSDTATRTSDYESIQEIVNYSQNILRSDKTRINDKIELAINNGIDPIIWRSVRKKVWFQPGGGATKAIKAFIMNLID